MTHSSWKSSSAPSGTALLLVACLFLVTWWSRQRPGDSGSVDSDGDGLSDKAESDTGTDPASFDMPVISVMEYSREAKLEDWRQPAYADRHIWTAAGSYRNTCGSGTNGAGAVKSAWISPSPWPDAEAMDPNAALNDFFDEVEGPLPWGAAQSVGTTLQAWLEQTWSWEEPYRVHRIEARQIRFFLKASRSMPIKLKAVAVFRRFTRQGLLDAERSADTEGPGSLPLPMILTLPVNQTVSNELTFDPLSLTTVRPWGTTDADPRTAGALLYTISIREFPYAVTTEDSDGDGLPNKVEKSLGTFSDNPDTDGDGRKDLFDFISSRPGTLPASSTDE